MTDARAYLGTALTSQGGPDRSFKQYIRARACCEWQLMKGHIIEWAVLLFFLLYVDLYVVRTLAFYRHRQIVDYIPQSWCNAIGNSAVPPADWKVNDTCVDHALDLANHGALFDVMQESFPHEPGMIAGAITTLWPETMQGFIILCVACACVGGSIFALPAAPGRRRPYLVAMVVRTLRVLFFVTNVRPFFYLGTSLPGPALKCVGAAEESFRPTKILDIFTDFTLSEHNCGDLFYSGHMSSISSMACVFLHYGRDLLDPHAKAFELLRAVLLVLLAIQGWMVVVVRNHYSIDVLGAVLMTFTTWRLFTYEFGEIHPSQYLPGFKEKPEEEKKHLLGFSEEEYATHTDYAGTTQGLITLALIVVIFLFAMVTIFSAMLGH